LEDKPFAGCYDCTDLNALNLSGLMAQTRDMDTDQVMTQRKGMTAGGLPFLYGLR
jgi:hypothetical protein